MKAVVYARQIKARRKRLVHMYFWLERVSTRKSEVKSFSFSFLSFFFRVNIPISQIVRTY